MLLETVRTGHALLAGPSTEHSAFFQARGLALALDDQGQARLPGGAAAVLNLPGAGGRGAQAAD